MNPDHKMTEEQAELSERGLTNSERNDSAQDDDLLPLVKAGN